MKIVTEGRKQNHNDVLHVLRLQAFHYGMTSFLEFLAWNEVWGGLYVSNNIHMNTQDFPPEHCVVAVL